MISDHRVDIAVPHQVNTACVTRFGFEQALWLSNRLGVKCAHQATPRKAMSHCDPLALPAAWSGGKLLDNSLEQTAIVRRSVDIGRNASDVYGIWLGLEGKERGTQSFEALAYKQGYSSCRPGRRQECLTGLTRGFRTT